MFLIRLLAAPLMILLATLVARRWGARIGGILGGLPLVSGPILVILALEHGEAFAAEATWAGLASLPGWASFVCVYAWLCRRWPWSAAWSGALLGYLAVGVCCLLLAPPAPWPVLVALVGLTVARLVLPAVASSRPHRPGRAELPLRLVVAGGLVYSVTTLGGQLGAGWSGLGSSFPVAATVLMVFTQRGEGPGGVAALARGMVAGMWSYATSLATFALLLPPSGLAIAGLVAIMVAVAVQMIRCRIAQR